ncbi:protein phosphatase 2C domain-containing protein [Rossellomorea vietnamensis]|uniref:Protein phosphatase 2C domain-containing protein n=1 Tax=Rossellomorea vietnamensis TaxID=218284 RepID=A0A5D4MIL3_9BACI|nr:protein phosphatase 2C domain-containing protein [Rossellomorea vietnamensis]TYS01417.1 protein phosphatase 2C domain-containing protein [Rossellomorea vietnamensis]
MIKEYKWTGSEKHFVDEIHLKEIEGVIVGHFGGNSASGQTKNEDGCLVWVDKKRDWEFALLLDAHNTAQSAEMVIKEIYSQKETILGLMNLEIGNCFEKLHELILAAFKGETFKAACKTVQGETACLFVVRKGNYVFWFSVGDCLLYLHHPDLSRLGEYQQNHRSFYEWVGEKSTFNKAVPCYSTGIKELRYGMNHILLTTDGLTECQGTQFDQPQEIFSVFENSTHLEGVRNLLQSIKVNHVRDSTTIVSWKIKNHRESTMPSDS